MSLNGLRTRLKARLCAVRPYINRIFRPGHVENTKKVVFFDIPNNPFGRHLVNLIIAFVKSEYAVVIKNRFNFIASLVGGSKYSRALLEMDGVYFQNKIPSDPAFTFCISHTDTENLSEVGIVIDPNVYMPEKMPNSATIPIQMHPNVPRERNWQNPFDSGTRPISVLFAGNTTSATYRSGILRNTFGILDRLQVVEVLEAHSRCRVPGSYSEMRDLLRCGYDGVVLAKRRKCAIPITDWRTVLARSDFFVCAPGIDMPLCHNVTEAMSVGAIPIIEYGSYMSPSLTPGKNCIAFQGAEGLTSAIEQALSANALEIETLRKGVQTYYQRYMEEGAIIENLEEKRGNLQTVYLNAGRRSALLYKSRCEI